jgi:hypothetical protein
MCNYVRGFGFVLLQWRVEVAELGHEWRVEDAELGHEWQC